jgi:hypothetical protein
MSAKHSSNTSGNGTRDLPVCSIVPQSTVHGMPPNNNNNNNNNNNFNNNDINAKYEAKRD